MLKIGVLGKIRVLALGIFFTEIEFATGYVIFMHIYVLLYEMCGNGM